jgi:hypothetical protein
VIGIFSAPPSKVKLSGRRKIAGIMHPDIITVDIPIWNLRMFCTFFIVHSFKWMKRTVIQEAIAPEAVMQIGKKRAFGVVSSS